MSMISFVIIKFLLTMVDYVQELLQVLWIHCAKAKLIELL